MATYGQSVYGQSTYGSAGSVVDHETGGEGELLLGGDLEVIHYHTTGAQGTLPLGEQSPLPVSVVSDIEPEGELLHGGEISLRFDRDLVLEGSLRMGGSIVAVVESPSVHSVTLSGDLLHGAEEISPASRLATRSPGSLPYSGEVTTQLLKPVVATGLLKLKSPSLFVRIQSLNTLDGVLRLTSTLPGVHRNRLTSLSGELKLGSDSLLTIIVRPQPLETALQGELKLDGNLQAGLKTTTSAQGTLLHPGDLQTFVFGPNVTLTTADGILYLGGSIAAKPRRRKIKHQPLARQSR